MSERQPRRLLIDTEALIIGEYIVLDIDYHLVKKFDTAEEAEAFVAEANGLDVETVRRETAQRGRMLAEYRENLRRKSREQ